MEETSKIWMNGELVDWAEKLLLNEVTEWYVVSKYGK